MIITGKKSYTPWNASNVERLLRDERLEKERSEKEKQKSRELQNEMRIEAMKKRKYGETSANAGDVGKEGPPKHNNVGKNHFNLFEEEEKKMLSSIGLDNERTRDRNGDKSAEQKTAWKGIMPVYLSKQNKECEANDEHFYKRKPILRPELDLKVKDVMDPMRKYHESDDIALKPPTKPFLGHASGSSTHRQKCVDSDDASSASSISERTKYRQRKRKRSRQREKKRNRKSRDKRSKSRIRGDPEDKGNGCKSKQSIESHLDELRRRKAKRNAQESERENAIRRNV